MRMKPSVRSRTARGLIFVVILGALAACAPNIRGTEFVNTQTPRRSLTYCLLYTPITHSKKDTEQTRWQIDQNNSRWECVCNADCEG